MTWLQQWDEMRSLLNELRRVETFEAAAEAVLDDLLTRCGALCAPASCFRGALHLRPDGGYEGLILRDRGGGEAHDFLPSSTAWVGLQRHGAPLALDVYRRAVTLENGEVQRLPRTEDAVFASRVGLMERLTTHVVALPVRFLRGELVGMIALEIAAPAGARPSWAAALTELQLRLDAAAPFLLSLPRAPGPTVTGDSLLPVVGARMRPLIELLEVFALQDETLLLLGATGAGKSRLSRWCHMKSPRAEGPFEHLDLITVPDDMQMAELLGWKRGAFTGAVLDYDGAVARAEGGTLFIDEIDKLSLRAQAGLLQLLEDRTYRVLGSKGGLKLADVRILVGSNADLHSLVREGRFREDLYYRICVLPLQIPSLDERADEIADWAAVMVARRQTSAGKGGSARLAPEAGALLARRSWPGNLRQLDNVVRRSYTVALARLGVGATAIEVTAADVERALGFEPGSAARATRTDGDTAGALEDAAAALARAVTAEWGEGRTLDLDHARAFEGLLIGALADALGDRREAYLALDREGLVKNRNDSKHWQKASQRVTALYEVLGAAPPLFMSDK